LVEAGVTDKPADGTKKPFDRKKYQRDYMRAYLPKWRAKQARKLQEN